MQQVTRVHKRSHGNAGNTDTKDGDNSEDDKWDDEEATRTKADSRKSSAMAPPALKRTRLV